MLDKGLKTLKELVRSVIEALVISALMFVLLWPVRVEGVSMKPLIADNDMLAICRLAGWAGLYDKGDIVVFDSEYFDKSLVKRVIATGGDTVKIGGGEVYVNGELLDEPYAEGYTDCEYYDVVPSDSVFVMGDNREESLDSRLFGTVEKKDIYGRVILRFFPFNKIKIF